MKKIVTIGGGTGSFVVLSGLKKHGCEISAIVAMSDSGGSGGRLRDEYGVLPTGDIRQCLVALSESDIVLRELFNYRFSNGSLEGQSFGNIFLTALSKVTGSFEKAVEEASKILNIKGKVIPVTTEDVQLCAELEDGTTVKGEEEIDEPKHDGNLRIRKLYLSPEAKANQKAVKAIEAADIIIIGPGALYTSILPNIIVKGIPEAISGSRAKKVYISNLMTWWGQTNGFGVKAHVEEIERHIGCKLDVVIINDKEPPNELLRLYESEKEFPVIDDIGNIDNSNRKLIRGDFLNDKAYKKAEADKLKRSLVRHDAEKLAKVIMEL